MLRALFVWLSWVDLFVHGLLELVCLRCRWVLVLGLFIRLFISLILDCCVVGYFVWFEVVSLPGCGGVCLRWSILLAYVCWCTCVLVFVLVSF